MTSLRALPGGACRRRSRESSRTQVAGARSLRDPARHSVPGVRTLASHAMQAKRAHPVSLGGTPHRASRSIIGLAA